MANFDQNSTELINCITDGELIEALDGPAAVARYLGIATSSVSGWSGKIPENRKIRLAVIAEDKGIATRQQIFPNDYQQIWIELRPNFSKAS